MRKDAPLPSSLALSFAMLPCPSEPPPPLLFPPRDGDMQPDASLTLPSYIRICRSNFPPLVLSFPIPRISVSRPTYVHERRRRLSLAPYPSSFAPIGGIECPLLPPPSAPCHAPGNTALCPPRSSMTFRRCERGRDSPKKYISRASLLFSSNCTVVSSVYAHSAIQRL